MIQGLGAGMTYTLTLDTVNVFPSGPLPKLVALKDDAAPVILDLTGLGPGVHAVEPKVPDTRRHQGRGAVAGEHRDHDLGAAHTHDPLCAARDPGAK